MEQEKASVNGLSRRWGWTRYRVELALEEWGASIEEPEIKNRNGNLTATTRQPKDIKNIDIADEKSNLTAPEQTQNPKKTTAKNNAEASIELFPDYTQEPAPGFSAEFVEGPWEQWCRTKKGGNYRNNESRNRALEKLYEMSKGDEVVAAKALQEAFDRQNMTYIYTEALKNHNKLNDNGTPYHMSQQSVQNPHAERNAARLGELFGSAASATDSRRDA